MVADSSVNRSIFNLKQGEDKVKQLNEKTVLGMSGEQTDRDTYGGGVMLRVTQGLTASVNAMRNVVMNDAGAFVEVQGTAEGAPFSRAEMDALLALAARGIGDLVAAQKAALAA